MSHIKALVFDTETTGLCNSMYEYGNLQSPQGLQSEPFIVQLAYIIADINAETGQYRIVKRYNQLIKPDGRYESMPEQAFNAHHKTYELCNEQGIDIRLALHEFMQDATTVNCIVAHNIMYDRKVIEIECVRNSMTDLLQSMHQICTQRLCKPFMNGGSANLSNAYARFNNGVQFDNAHDALADVLACLDVFINCCKKVGVWPMPDSVSAIQCYSTQYHQQVPKYDDVDKWCAPAQIDIATISSTDMQNTSIELVPIISNKHIYISQPTYDAQCCLDHNVDIAKCQAGLQPFYALSLLMHYIQCSRLIVVHNAKFHLGMLNAACKHEEVYNSLKLKQYLFDTELYAEHEYLSGGQKATRDMIFEHFHKRALTADITAAQSILHNFTSLYRQYPTDIASAVVPTSIL